MISFQAKYLIVAEHPALSEPAKLEMSTLKGCLAMAALAARRSYAVTATQIVTEQRDGALPKVTESVILRTPLTLKPPFGSRSEAEPEEPQTAEEPKAEKNAKRRAKKEAGTTHPHAEKLAALVDAALEAGEPVPA